MTDVALAPAHSLAGYDDWPHHARTTAGWSGPDASATALGRVLGLRELPPSVAVRVIDEQTNDDLSITQLSWSIGYGPDTTAWLVRPASADEPLPGVLAMHCHGGVRSVGGEQLVDLGTDSSASAQRLRASGYDGRAPANDLARRGFAVLVHDTFSWGSRAFDLSRPTPRLARAVAAQEALWREQGVHASADERFDFASGVHEETLAKAAGALGQTFAGLVLTDDLIALQVLAGLPGVDPECLGTFGFSGGGGRALLLSALDHRLRACVTACMMATFDSLVPDFLDAHSWLLHVPGLWSFADWPELTALGRADHLVQYRKEDELFSPDGMRAADRRLAERHGASGRYRGSFFDGGHAFGAVMQNQAWDFLVDRLNSTMAGA